MEITQHSQTRNLDHHHTTASFNSPNKLYADSAIGIGQIGSSALSSVLPQKIAPRLFQIGAAAPRFLGGLATAGLSGLRIAQAFNSEHKSGSTNYQHTRREIVISAASIAGGFAAGSATGLAVAGAAMLGAPVAVIGGITLGGVALVGWTAYKVRDYLESKI